MSSAAIKILLRFLRVFALVFAASTANAAVNEHLIYTSYPANVDASRPLYIVLNESTPHRQNGHVFHAYTDWSVNWKSLRYVKIHGRCKIGSIKTEFVARIDLPRLVGASATQAEQFEKYLSALREHELGHYYIGKETAGAIDRKILSLPASNSCQALKLEADKIAYRTSREYKAMELQYDQATENGKLQGAWLDD